MLNWLSLWQSMTWICKALTEACPSCILPGESFSKHGTAARAFFFCSSLLLPVLPLRRFSPARNYNLLPAHQDHSGSALHRVCHCWAPSAASVSQPATSTSPASGDITDRGCPLPALTVQVWAGPGGGGKRGWGEFCEVPSHHLDLEVWSQSPRGCRLQFVSFLADGSLGGVWCLLVP